MQTYRAYIIEDEKTFKNFKELKAGDDDEAVEKASRLVDNNVVELWEGARRIGTLKPVKQRAA